MNQYTTVYKRGGHAPCSCDVTLKKDDGSVDVDDYSALQRGLIMVEENFDGEHTLKGGDDTCNMCR